MPLFNNNNKMPEIQFTRFTRCVLNYPTHTHTDTHTHTHTHTQIHTPTHIHGDLERDFLFGLLIGIYGCINNFLIDFRTEQHSICVRIHIFFFVRKKNVCISY